MVSLQPVTTLRLPAWPQRITWLRRAAAAISVAAIVVDLIAVLVQGGSLVALTALLLSIVGVVLAWFRPWIGLSCVVAGCTVAALGGWDPTALWTVVIYTIFSVVLAGLPATVVGAGGAAFLYALLALRAADKFSDPAAVTAAVAAVAAAGVAGALRAQGRYWRVLDQRALDAVAARQREVDRKVVEERLRIARDLHDLLGHEVAVLNMHLGVAEVSLPQDAGRSKSALLQARSAVQSMLQETQQILAVLRQDSTQPDSNQPIPGVDRVLDLVQSFQGIGLDVEVEIDPTLARRVDPATGLAIYRIIQEALTNAHRYGDGTARLRTTVGPTTVEITIDNPVPDGSTRAGSGFGHGLIGMHERAESIGGTIEAVRNADGYHIHASLPVRPEDHA